ncbi:MAG: glutamate-1-semialdehyde-2,1-aminomutase [Deltaproteobacteria bacterium]|nr:MAG: glutamate-1-semialdehyde-2,1-aminomutase [Deltaproteobacteria bacterium]
MSRSSRWLSRGEKVIPGGVNSPVRAFSAVGGEPPFIARGEGVELIDEDGHHYLDCICSWGALMLGHAPVEVVGAITKAASAGTTYGAPTGAEVELAEELVDRVPSIEMVRLCSSGTEATMHAIRLARGATGRDLIVKFDGCYHGAHDACLVGAGSGVATFGIPGSPGVPEGTAQNTVVLPYNDLAAVEELFAERGGAIAAVILEPVAGNMGCIPPREGYLEGLRAVTQRHGTVLIFDEVMTGLRVARGGAQERFGVTPDLTCLGKVVGGGLPMAAFGGRADLMRELAPTGPVYQAGTLSGNPVAVAAARATLSALTEARYAHLEHVAAAVEDGVRDAVAYHGWSMHRVGSMFTLFARKQAPWDFAEVKECDTRAFGRFFRGALSCGVYLPPSQFEAVFLSAAMTEVHVATLVGGIEAALVAANA